MKQKMRQKQKQLYIGPSVEHILNSNFLLSQRNYLLLSTKRSLMIMNRQVKSMATCKLLDQKILHSAYHPLLDLYLISTDRGLMFINGEGQLIKQQKITELLQAKFIFLLPMQDGYKGVPNFRKDKLLYITNENMFFGEIEIFNERGMVKNKNICDIKLQFTEKPSIVLDAPEWVAKIKYIKNANSLICWNPAQTYIFSLPTNLQQNLKTTLVYTKISKRQNKINDFEICLKHRLLIVGHQFGSIKIYKYDETKKYVSELKGHQRQCTSLYISQKNPNFVYSAGLDATVRIWDLLDFNEIYQIKIDIIIDKIQILSEKLAFVKFDENRKACLCKYNLDILQPVRNQGNSGNLTNIMSDGEWGIALYSNNYAECFQLQNSTKTQKIQFPLKYGSLRQSVRVKENCYIVCVQKGFSVISLKKQEMDAINFELKRLVYNHSLRQNQKQQKNTPFIQMIHEKLLDTFLFSTIEDWKGIPFLINVTSVTLLFDILLPMWDIDMKGKAVKEKKDFVILGTDKGYIYFIDLKDKLKFYTRLHQHSNSIIKINLFKLDSEKKDEINFFSVTNNNEFAIWSLSFDQNPRLKCRIPFCSQISFVQTFSEYMIVGYITGKVMILRVKQRQGSLKFQCDNTNLELGHMKNVISCDFIVYEGHNLFLTTSEDMVLKIWLGLRKQLLLEIKFFSQIHNAIFLHQNADIMISHGETNQISLLKSKNIPELNLLENIKKINYCENCIEVDIKSQLSVPQKKQTQRPKSPRVHSPKSPGFNSPDNPKVVKIENKSYNLESSLVKIQEPDEMYKNKQFQTPISKRKQKLRRYKKETQGIHNQSLFLPKLPMRQHYKQSPFLDDFGSRGTKILERVEMLRGKSFSVAGRKNF